MQTVLKRAPYLPKWTLYGWFLYFIAAPFYVFDSGMPQPADWVMALLFMYLFIVGARPAVGIQQQVVSKHWHFVFYVTLVNTIWFFFIDQSREKRFPTIVHSFFYIFNFFTLRAVLILFTSYQEKFLKYTAYAVGAGMIIQAGLSFVMGSTGSRNALFFNNPNQLGYYALLSGSLFMYVTKHLKLPSYFQLAAFFSFFYLTLLSSSKAALVGSLILITLAVINQGLLSFKRFVVLGVAIGIGFYFVSNQELGSGLLRYSLNRFEMIGESKDDSYEGRGYDRMLNNPEYMIIGAGEGGYYRFDTLLSSGEIHSSFGTIIFCYGILGFFLFFRFVFAIFFKSSFFDVMYFVPIVAYSITHQGLRDSLLWVFLGVVFVVNCNRFFSRVLNQSVKHKLTVPVART